MFPTHIVPGEPPPTRFNLARYCLEAYEHRPERVGLTVVSDVGRVQDAEQWTFRALSEAVRRAAAQIQAATRPGDRVVILVGNESAFPIAFFGTIAAGRVAVPLSPQLSDREVSFVLADSGARLVIGEARWATPNRLVLSRDTIMSGAPAGAMFADTHRDDPAYLVYTSGTTRNPKGVLHAHRAIWGRRPMIDGWYGLTPDDVVLHAGALNWTYTLGTGLCDPWSRGATAVVYNGPNDPRVWPKLLESTRATLFATVPGLYRRILKYGDLADRDLSALRHGLVAGEALDPLIRRQWMAATGGAELYEALGMSEISTYISSGPHTPVRDGSPGRPQPGRRVAILPIDGGDTPLPPNTRGLLAIHRSDPGLLLRYWNRPDEDAAVRRGEWFVGGDLASLSDDGYVTFHGRVDDVMTAMGYRVSPLEVESVLRTHPAVHEVACTTRELKPGVDGIVAFAVRAASASADASAVLDYAAAELAAYKRPRRLVWVESLPRNRRGKLVRAHLPALAAPPNHE